jgi:nucleoside-diphosphate-sugar epimerase
MVEAFAQQYGLKYVVWRPFNVMSPHEKSESEIGTSHVFADYIKNIVLEKRTVLPIVGDGEQIRCFTWIGDIARGIADHSFSEKAENNAFNLGNPEPITMKQLAEIIYKGAQERGLVERSDVALQFETQASFQHDVRLRIPDVSKAKEILGWEPTLKVVESVGRCLDLIVSDSREGAVSA